MSLRSSGSSPSRAAILRVGRVDVDVAPRSALARLASSREVPGRAPVRAPSSAVHVAAAAVFASREVIMQGLVAYSDSDEEDAQPAQDSSKMQKS